MNISLLFLSNKLVLFLKKYETYYFKTVTEKRAYVKSFFIMMIINIPNSKVGA